jgi:hypothetical protein
MDVSESGSNSGSAIVGEVPTNAVSSGEIRFRAGRIWAFALTAGVAAGLISWVGGELAFEAFKPRLFNVPSPVGGATLQPTVASTNVAEFKNAILAFAILGCVTGLAMGFSGGLAGRSPSRGVKVGLSAQAAGALVGALASLTLLRFFYRGLVQDLNDLWSPLLIHGGIWMAIGAVGGSAFALGLGCQRRLHAAIGGAVFGGFFASVLYQTVSASFFPDSQTNGPVGTSSSVRLVAMLSVTLLIAAGAARGSLGGFTRLASPTAAH